MSQGISSSLNLTLARLSSIESNFTALQSVMGRAGGVDSSSNIQNEFKTILDNKIKEAENKNPIEAIVEEIVNDVAPEKKEALELKSKIDLKAQSTNVEEIIDTFAQKYDIDADFIKAMIKQESGFNSKATSKKGAMGLMQLMPATAKELGVVDAYNPTQNIEGGVKYIKSLLDKFQGDEKLALDAYNAGPNAVKKYGGIPPYKETQNYVNSIMSTYNKVKEAKL